MDDKRIKLEDILASRFDLKKFKLFCIQYFNNDRPELKLGKECEIIWKEYEEYIKSFVHIGTYEDPEGFKLAVLAVKIKRTPDVERTRSMERNYVAKFLKINNYDAGLVAFYSEDTDDRNWKLSFVRLDYEFTAKSVKLELIPARRYSYLAGESEPNHTARIQLLPIFQDDRKSPLLDEIEDAFSVEKVTRYFFDQYKDKYIKLKEYLEGDEAFISESDKLGIQAFKFSEQFAKKLMGQLVFLYFLQKKGWLGVEPGREWGSGDRRFIRHLFDSCIKTTDKNFFNNYLEPLFYEALNKKRKDYYFERFDCMIPFLNCGLFEPLEGYNWNDVDFSIPNDVFSNEEYKGKDADGILDIFDSCNFTISEAEPLEKEVAVDPEMLGSIFENLLGVKDRKSKGAFYTPREIVHYMCQEGLINYLVNKVGVPYDDMKEFILYGELIRDADNRRGINDEDLTIKQTIFNNIVEIDNALKSVRIADPAVGSGAFPLGMLSEIIRARNNITGYIIRKNREESHENRYDEKFIRKWRSSYKMKLETIKNNIFAMDIEPSAIDITKLRLWLSVVVDQEINDETPEPHPLPNLDWNIMVGNSLVDEYESIKLKEFKGKDGFDIVIGNPPYVDYRKIDSITKKGLHDFETYRATKNASLYVYFIEKGYDILNPNGTQVFINPCQYLSADSGFGLRKLMISKRAIKKIVDLSNVRVFDSASTYTCINVFSKRTENMAIEVFSPQNLKILETNAHTLDYDSIGQEDNYVILLNPNPVVTRVDMVATKLKNFAHVFCGTSMTGFRKFVISKDEYDKTGSREYAPLLESSDIQKFRYNLKSYAKRSIFHEKVQDVFDNNDNLFLARMTNRVRVCRAKRGFFAGKVNCITDIELDIDYLTAVLNSSLIDYYYNTKNESKHLRGGYLGFDIPSVESIPIPRGDREAEMKLSALAKAVYENMGDDEYVEELQDKIDETVYRLYDLSPEEIETVEENKAAN